MVVHESTVGSRFPRWVFSRRGCCVDSYSSWVSTNNGYGGCCPRCGVRKGVAGWVGVAEVDEGAVFACCFPRSRNRVVSFYETAASPPANSLVSTHCWWVRCCPQCGSPQASGNGRGDTVAGWLCTNRRWVRVCPGAFSVGGGVVSIRTIHGYAPIMGAGGVVHNAESSEVVSWATHMKKHPM